ncbi:hypothetical protein GBAR_LOCUS3552 [Geodia barretti]|uniref:Uncharacterized protein n=1 Tax=Geodia barretti TaxID=519541 RepID=A0AA35R4K1_GEOBA|nr:hypothetical protein GBAR_LOCUS3552 [Geodia barretti]
MTLCVVVGLSGCILASNPSYNWSKNIALDATSEDTKCHDDNMYSVGETGPILEDEKDEASQQESDDYTEVVLKWRQPQTIQQVVVKAEPGQMEFFYAQYMDDDGKWVTVKHARDNMRPIYKFTLGDPIVTTKFSTESAAALGFTARRRTETLYTRRNWGTEYTGVQEDSRD